MTLSPALSALAIPGSVALILAGMWLVSRLAKRWGWSAEIQRKLVHVTTGLFAMALPWLLPSPALVYGLLAATLLVMLVLRLPSIAKGSVGRVVHGVERSSWGDVMLVLAVATLYFSSGEASTPVLYLLPLAILTVSDAAAAVAGSAYGRMHYVVEDGQKSVEGSLVFFMITWILAMSFLLLLSDVPRATVVLLSFIAAAFATLLEADSWRGFDNYFVPVGVLLLLATNLDSSSLTLVLLAVGFIAGFAFIHGYGGPLLGLSAHTSRAYTAGLFMISAVTVWPNMILPTLALVAQTFARRFNPSDSRHPDLDMLGLLAALSFAALLGGSALGVSAISFYSIACAAIALQCAMLALADRSLVIRLGSLAVMGLALAGGLFILTALHQGQLGVMAQLDARMLMGPLIIASLVIAALVSTAFPAFYRTARYAKVSVVGALIPYGAFVALFLAQEGIAS
ncbi:MAG: hypothetical protein KI785_00900 [Devosiaceae bacterium]|nr:hypothetical protein [Devosiaceae bacterium MH13]